MTVNTETVWSAHGAEGWDNAFPLEKADHAMGLELQIVELVEQQTRARVQHREDDAERFEGEISQLRTELAATAEVVLPQE